MSPGALLGSFATQYTSTVTTPALGADGVRGGHHDEAGEGG